MDLKTARIGGETLSEPLPVAPSTIDAISFNNMMKRE
jgi:hypothetical protein